MKRIPLSNLQDVEVMSYILDQALFCLHQPPVSLTSTALSRALALHNAQITYMRRLHSRPDYARLVSPHLLYKVLAYLTDLFPTMAIEQLANGKLRVKLYKTLGRVRMEQYPPGWEPPVLILRKEYIRPGTTRWFLRQSEQSS